MDGLFSLDRRPLAARIRPETLPGFRGHEELLGAGGPVDRLISSKRTVAAVLAGPPGIGKTTLARIIAARREAEFVALPATTAGVRDIKEMAARGSARLRSGEGELVVFVDEIHRFSRTQQDALLGPTEEGSFSLLGATTENPYATLSPALLSRITVIRMRALSPEGIAGIVAAGAAEEDLAIPEEVVRKIVTRSSGDARKALQILEALGVQARNDTKRRLASPAPVLPEDLEQLLEIPSAGIDESLHYELTSALIKSLRASDAAGALHYLARLVVAGEDPRFIARRLAIFAAEDVGLADPQALPIAGHALGVVSQIGMPEGRIVLAEAALYLAQAPKSRTVIELIDAAISEASQRQREPVPEHLRGTITSIEGRYERR